MGGTGHPPGVPCPGEGSFAEVQDNGLAREGRIENRDTGRELGEHGGPRMDGTVHPLTTSTNDKTERTRSWKDPLGLWQVPNPGEWIWGSRPQKYQPSWGIGSLMGRWDGIDVAVAGLAGYSVDKSMQARKKSPQDGFRTTKVLSDARPPPGLRLRALSPGLSVGSGWKPFPMAACFE